MIVYSCNCSFFPFEIEMGVQIGIHLPSATNSTTSHFFKCMEVPEALGIYFISLMLHKTQNSFKLPFIDPRNLWINHLYLMGHLNPFLVAFIFMMTHDRQILLDNKLQVMRPKSLPSCCNQLIAIAALAVKTAIVKGTLEDGRVLFVHPLNHGLVGKSTMVLREKRFLMFGGIRRRRRRNIWFSMIGLGGLRRRKNTGWESYFSFPWDDRITFRLLTISIFPQNWRFIVMGGSEGRHIVTVCWISHLDERQVVLDGNGE